MNQFQLFLCLALVASVLGFTVVPVSNLQQSKHFLTTTLPSMPLYATRAPVNKESLPAEDDNEEEDEEYEWYEEEEDYDEEEDEEEEMDEMDDGFDADEDYEGEEEMDEFDVDEEYEDEELEDGMDVEYDEDEEEYEDKEEEYEGEIEEDEEEGFDLEALFETAEEALAMANQEASGERDEVEMLASIEETPTGKLTLNQVHFMRDIMAYFVSEESTDEEPYNPEESTAPVVEKLLFRLLDEWQFAIEESEDDDRASALLPTIEDFTNAFKAWQKDALFYSKSRRRDANGNEAIEKVQSLLEILQELWKEAGIDSLKPNKEILEIVLSVMAVSREPGMDRKVGDLFDSVRTVYGMEPTCNMYQSHIMALATSRHRSSSKQAETLLREAASKFPPKIDARTGLPTGIKIETFNKVLVSWAKSGFDYGPERAENLIVFMDDLDRESGELGLVKPNLQSFTTLIDAYAQQNEWDSVMQAERIFNRVLDHYLEGVLDDAPNLATWTIVIGAWSRLARKNRRGAETHADKLLKRMEALYEDGRLDYAPDAIAYSTCMNAWAFSKNPIGPTQAELILDEMYERYMDGDDTMRPSARSVQTVVDAWAKMGTEEGMEQAELVLDQYEDHLEELVSSDESQLEHFANIYKSMLLGWSKCDSTRAYDYLLDMMEKDMPLDNFLFDRVIEAEAQRISEDPSAMDRIREVLDTLEKCCQAGKVLPNERVFTSYIRAMTRAHEDNLAEKANEVLQRMHRMSEEGNNEMIPTLFTYNAVINACAESINCDGTKPADAFKIALGVFNPLRQQRNGLDHVTCGNMIRCANLMPEGEQKEKFIKTAFKLACDKGLVNTFVVRDLQAAAPEEIWRGILRCPEGEVNMDLLPRSWSATLIAKENARQAFEERKGNERRGNERRGSERRQFR